MKSSRKLLLKYAPIYRSDKPHITRRYSMWKRFAFLVAATIVVTVIGSLIGRDFAVFASIPQVEVTGTITPSNERRGMTTQLIRSRSGEGSTETSGAIPEEQRLHSAGDTLFPSPASTPQLDRQGSRDHQYQDGGRWLSRPEADSKPSD